MTEIWDGGDFTGTKLLLTHNDALLTCLRDDFDHIPFPNYWDLPGGARDEAETPLQCGLRELDEEFGITLPAEHEQRFAVKELVDRLMGRNPEHRFNFIQNRAGELERDLIDA